MENMNSVFFLRKKTNIVNSLFQNNVFIDSLCEYFNYDLEKIIDGISRIVNYYLNSDDTYPELNVSSLFAKINSFTLDNNSFVMFPTNSNFKHSLRIPRRYEIGLKYLEANVAFNLIDKSISCEEGYEDVEEAVSAALTWPDVLFKSILKVPYGEEQILEEDEKLHYISILETRLKNVKTEKKKTCAKVASKTINLFIGKNPLLLVMPKSLVRSSKQVNSMRLSYIELPTKFELTKICNQNKPPKQTEKTVSERRQTRIFIKYSRYELVPVTDRFIYTNSGFTGDIDYDIDLMYGYLDTNYTDERISTSSETNIENIKKRHDVIVRKLNGKYEIVNGRHRILYMKNYYAIHYPIYLQENRLEALEEIVSMPMNVERYIEDPDINKILGLLYKEYTSEFYKADCSNDLPEIISIINNKVYITHNYEELRDLYYKLKNNEDINEYFISFHVTEPNYDYTAVISYLIITLRDKIYTMNFYEMATYILENGFCINNNYYYPESLNYNELYSHYLVLRANIGISTVLNLDWNIIESEMTKLKLAEISKSIMDVISSNPAYVNLPWNKLLEILKENEVLRDLDDETLATAAKAGGYHALKLMNIGKSNPFY